jgi:hypothetical protein
LEKFFIKKGDFVTFFYKKFLQNSPIYFLLQLNQNKIETKDAPKISKNISFCASQTSPCEPKNAAPDSPPSITA